MAVVCHHLPYMAGFPCGMWVLFHMLLAHAPEAKATVALHGINQYVDHIFGCAECSEHYGAMAATLQDELRSLKAYGKRGRAELWLWQV